jgi:soluble lytic murein transglycosylase-like protein
MTACNANLSAARREILAEQIRVVGEAFFAKKEERRWYYFLICIESKFQNEARSPVGAVGLTQVMPKYASEFAKACQLGALEPKDLNDSQVNLMVGACRFRELMVHYSGDPTLALAAYNSGLDSPTVRKAVTSDVRQGHPETVGYLAAAFILEQRMNKASK